MRQGNLELARNARVLPVLGRLGGVPKRRAIPRPIGRNAFRQDDLGMFDALLAAEIMRDAVALVGQPLAGAIGGRRHGAAAARPRNRLHACVIDRQRAFLPFRSMIGATDLRSKS
jgi:hypothetical protein